ncbi:MAG: glycosyltransferase family 39 protein [Chloroflexi bacterium]|nr:glycosyltransferase family 39 protein [Chloroflexota bacterium]
MAATDSALGRARAVAIPSLRPLTARDAVFAAGLLLALAGAAVVQTPWLAAGALGWALGLLVMVASTTYRQTIRDLLAIRIGRLEAVSLGVVLACAAAARLWSLADLPLGIHIDEAVMGLIARDILQGRGPHPFGFAFISDPAPLMYVKAAAMALFGQGMFPQRLVAALAGIGSVAALWVFARPLFGSGVALLATTLLAVTVSHIFFSRLALTIIEIPFLGLLAVALIWRGLRTEQVAWHTLGGVALGFAQYANFGARAFVLAVAALYLVMMATHYRSWWPIFRGGVLAAIGMLAVLGPQLAYVRDDPYQLYDRLQFRSVFRRWDQATEIHQTTDPVRVMLGQAIINVRAFVDVPDRGTFFEFAHEPLLYGPVAALLVVGVAVALWRVGQPRYACLFLISGGVLLGGIMSAGAPQFHRLVALTPVACLFAAIGLLTVCQGIDRVIGRFRPSLVGVVPLAMSLLLVGATTADTANAMLVRYPAELPWQPHSAWARWVAEQPAGRTVYVAGAPEVRAWDERLRFLAESRPLTDLTNLSEAVPALLADPRPATIALSPRLADWQPTLEQMIPGATFGAALGPDGKVAIVTVDVPAGPRPAAEPRGLQGVLLIDDSQGEEERHRLDAVLAFREASALTGNRPFDVTWTGSLLADRDGAYRFECLTDGVAELTIDGKPVLSAKRAAEPRVARGEARLTPGQHAVTVTYSYQRGPGTFELRWQPPDGARTLIPPSAFRPE